MAAGATRGTAPRALVLGASGHLGNAVVRELLARDHAVTAARRGRTAARNLADLPVTHALGDAEDPATLERWIAGHDLVVDAAAPYPLSLLAPPAAGAVVRRATALVDAITRHCARLVHIGSFVTGLGTDDTGRPREPGQRLSAELHPYFVAKRAEQAVLTAAALGGAPITSVHPTVCLGPWDSHPGVLSIIPMVLAGRLPVVPAHVINVIDVRDVARGVVAAAAASCPGPSLLLTGHNIAVPELCTWIGELAGCAVKVRAVPAGIVQAAAWTAELVTLGAAMPPPLLPTLLVLRHAPLPISAAQRALGVNPRPLSVTLRDAIAWYRGEPSRLDRTGL
jgi:dihydroflavonol-4-reductase